VLGPARPTAEWNEHSLMSEAIGQDVRNGSSDAPLAAPSSASA